VPVRSERARFVETRGGRNSVGMERNSPFA